VNSGKINPVPQSNIPQSSKNQDQLNNNVNNTNSYSPAIY
jgi:hypothetical protein